MSFPEALAKLAEKVASKAADDATPLQERVDALKALTPYYALLLKRKPESPQDGAGGPSFADFAARLDTETAAYAAEETQDGGAQVRSRRRRN